MHKVIKYVGLLMIALGIIALVASTLERESQQRESVEQVHIGDLKTAIRLSVKDEAPIYPLPQYLHGHVKRVTPEALPYLAGNRSLFNTSGVSLLYIAELSRAEILNVMKVEGMNPDVFQDELAGEHMAVLYIYAEHDSIFYHVSLTSELEKSPVTSLLSLRHYVP
jgi:hypothetical protein